LALLALARPLARRSAPAGRQDRPALNWRRVGLLGMAALVGLLALNLAQTPVSPDGLNGYTLLWAQPAETSNRLLVGVRSEEFSPTSYWLEFENAGTVKIGPAFSLRPGETHTIALDISAETSQQQPVTVRLYRSDQLEWVYRWVVWWPGSGVPGKASQ
ncbi:MAG: hypothetical protein ACKOC5_10730, partial [Chloroflexota bacterium]